MRKIFFIIALLAALPIYSQWLPNGNNMKLDTKGDKVNDFVISEDSKFIYTLGDSGVIAKYDAGSGERVWRKKIEFPAGLTYNETKVFLSNDSKSYCWTHTPLKIDDQFQIIEIYDIETDKHIDSINTPYGSVKSDPRYGGIYYNTNITMLDWNSKTLSLICEINETQGDFWNTYSDGHIYILNKRNNNWLKLFDVSQSNDLIFFSKSKDLCFKQGYSNDYHNPGHHSDTYFGVTDQNCNLYWVSDSTIKNIYNFHVNYSAGWLSDTTGTKLDYSTGIFSNDERYLMLIDNNHLHQYEINSLNNINNIDIKNFPQYYGKISLYNALTKEYFYTTIRNTLSIYKTNNILLSNEIILDSVKNISKLINLADSTCTIFQDDEGNIYKIINIEFLLNADFSTSHFAFTTSDSIYFYDLSTGFPDNYLWDFGDGTTSFENNPMHIYKKTGYFDIKLKIFKNSSSDSIIKQHYIDIVPDVKADFSYVIKKGYPTIVEFNNLSVGEIDYLTWNFGDGEVSSSFLTNHDYKIPGTYNVELTVYSKANYSSIHKFIKIEVNSSELEKANFNFEFCDTNFPNSFAVKGYEDKTGQLVYQIDHSSLVHIGIYNKFVPKWDYYFSGGSSKLVKCDNDVITYLHNDSLYNFDVNGNLMNKIQKSDYKVSCSMYSDGNKVNIGYLLTMGCYMDIWESNSIVDSNVHLRYPFIGTISSQTHNYSILCENYLLSRTGSQYDFAGICKYTAIKNGTTLPFIDSIFEVNFKQFNYYRNINDILRINVNLLLVAGDSIINIIETDGCIFSKNPCSLYQVISKPDFSFRSLLKLNDTAFAVAGSYRGSPNVMIFNDKGTILDSITLSDRFGEFEFVSLTPDNKLLLSGYRYMTYQVKSPYFVKFGDDILANLLPKSGVTPEKSLNKEFTALCYPNPTNGIATIKFNLPVSGTVKLSVYDTFGQIVISNYYNEYSAGENVINFDLSSFAPGIYFYELETNAGNISRKIVNIK